MKIARKGFTVNISNLAWLPGTSSPGSPRCHGAPVRRRSKVAFRHPFLPQHPSQLPHVAQTDIGRTPKCAGHLIAFAHRHAQPLEAVAPAAHNANNAIDDPPRVRSDRKSVV